MKKLLVIFFLCLAVTLVACDKDKKEEADYSCSEIQGLISEAPENEEQKDDIDVNTDRNGQNGINRAESSGSQKDDGQKDRVDDSVRDKTPTDNTSGHQSDGQGSGATGSGSTSSGNNGNGNSGSANTGSGNNGNSNSGAANAGTGNQQGQAATKPGSSNTTQPSNGQEDNKPVHTHSWLARYKTITIVDRQAYDEPLYRTVEHTICNQCGADITGHAVAHLQASDQNYINNGYQGSQCYSYRTEYRKEESGSIHHEAQTHEEKIIDYYICSCGQRKQAIN